MSLRIQNTVLLPFPANAVKHCPEKDKGEHKKNLEYISMDKSNRLRIVRRKSSQSGEESYREHKSICTEY